LGLLLSVLGFTLALDISGLGLALTFGKMVLITSLVHALTRINTGQPPCTNMTIVILNYS